MNLVQIGFLSITLLALADGFLLASGGGFGGISGILGILLLLLFIAALTRKTNTNIVADCPANYTLIPNYLTTCIRFLNTPTKDIEAAFLECTHDGGYILRLNASTFPMIQQMAENISGGCSYWVDAHEESDGTWYNYNDVPIPATPGLFFLNSTNGNPNDCGLMSNADNFFLIGATCSEMHCYICQKNKTIN